MLKNMRGCSFSKDKEFYYLIEDMIAKLTTNKVYSIVEQICEKYGGN